MWIAEAEYADGTEIKRGFVYNEGGNYHLESERQYELECWLINKCEQHGDVLWYSVTYQEVFET